MTQRSVAALTRGAFALGLLFLTACAHQVSIAPQLNLSRDSSALVEANVGYLITDAQRNEQVTTPGGGGDKISYNPYRDLESALYSTLASVFTGVFVVPDASAEGFIEANELRFVFMPVITSDSRSSNVMLWNPTDFTLTLSIRAENRNGETVWSREFVGEGNAPAGGSLTENRAAQAAAIDVFRQLQRALQEEPIFQR